ncbi:hypothetical protein [Deminuibacter soli]|nr:hypothetical protein [Deminuibacter soli]
MNTEKILAALKDAADRLLGLNTGSQKPKLVYQPVAKKTKQIGKINR